VKINTKRVLILSDLHIPAEHPSAYDFLSAINKQFKPTYVISIGDILDVASIQASRPNSPIVDSPILELSKTRKKLKKYQKLFPKLDITIGNHDLRVRRKAELNGIPADFLKDFNQLLDIEADWKWHDKVILKIDGQDWYFTHNFKRDVLQSAKELGCSFVSGHFHTQYSLSMTSSPSKLITAISCGCLIDPHHPAFEYQKTFIKRPVIGTAIIDNGVGKLIPMPLKNNKWTGNLVI